MKSANSYNSLKAFFFAFVLFSSLYLKPSAGFAVSEDRKYFLTEGDRIEISVWNNDELKREVIIRPDGWVSFPLVGEVFAAGFYPEVLAAQIAEKLKKYIKTPKVTVIVLEYRSQKVLIIGEVKKPGLYPFEVGMSAFDSIGVASGYEKHAELKSILVVRNGYAKRPEFYLVNLYHVIHDMDRSSDIKLKPGDIVYVPQNFIGNVSDFLDFFMSRIKPAADTYALYAIAKNQ